MNCCCGYRGQRLWCIAKPVAYESDLLVNINYACSQSGVDSLVPQNGNPCYYSNTLAPHAAVAMNFYFQDYGRNYWNYYSNNTRFVVLTDPSKYYSLMPKSMSVFFE